MIHKLKTVQPYFSAVAMGLKTFEVRKNDRDFKAGDEVHLQEYDPFITQYSGKCLSLTITYVLRNYPAIDAEYVVFGFNQVVKFENLELLKP